MPGSSSWMPYAPQGVKGLDDDDDDSECVSVALAIEHAIRMRHIVTCGLCGSDNIFLHYLINGTMLLAKLLNIKCAFGFSLRLLSKYFSFYKEMGEI